MAEYRVRALKQRRGQPDHKAANFVITVPAHIGRKVVGKEFTFKLTDEGMLYSIVKDGESAPNPDWLENEEPNNVG